MSASSRRSARGAMAALWGVVGWLWLACGALAQAPEALPAGPAPVPAPLDLFVEGYVRNQIDSGRAAGIGIAVVKDGAVVLLEGYGQAKADGAPVDPQRTLFRLGSISKTFTWISLLQLADEGRLDLDKPVNDYLPPALRIPDDRFAPATVRDLMHHAAGFEDQFAGALFLADPEAALPLSDQLALHRPHRVRAPGGRIVYSNYGAALAGAVVQRVAGKPFEDYVEERIFTPLGLQNTTFREPYAPSLVQNRGLPSPMSPALAGDLAEGFLWRDGAFEPQPFEHVVQYAPAGSASSTPADMSRYMLMLLAGLPDTLKPESARLFSAETATHANAPGMAGVAAGMMQGRSPGGARWYGHLGATISFRSALKVYPSSGIGVFVAENSGSEPDFAARLADIVADRLLGVAPPSPPPPADAAALRRFAGAYRSERISATRAERILCALACETRFTVTDGRLAAFEGGTGRSWRLAKLDVQETRDGGRAHRFQSLVDGAVSAFLEKDGKITAYVPASGVIVQKRVSAFASSGGLFWAMGVGFVAALAGVLSGALRLFGPNQPSSAARLVGILLPASGLAFLVALGAAALYLGQAAADTWVVFTAWPGALATTAWASAVGAALLVATCVAAAFAWIGADWSLGRRARLLATIAGLALLTAALHAWNLLGPRF